MIYRNINTQFVMIEECLNTQNVIFNYPECYDVEGCKYPICYNKHPKCYDSEAKGKSQKQIRNPKHLNMYYKQIQTHQKSRGVVS